MAQDSEGGLKRAGSPRTCCQSNEDEHAADEFQAGDERGLQSRGRNSQRAKVFDESGQLAKLAEAGAEEFEPERESDHEPSQPLEGVEPCIETA